MKILAGFILVVFAVVIFGGAGWAVFSAADLQIIKDERQIIAATTNCSKGGVRISFIKQGDRPNRPCDDRELSRLMLLSGMGEQARFKECSMPDSRRDFATVHNCLNYEEVGLDQVLADVEAKSQKCGGKRSAFHWIKNKKYTACMAS